MTSSYKQQIPKVQINTPHTEVDDHLQSNKRDLEVDEKDFKEQDIPCSHETSPKAKNKKYEIMLFPINIHFTN